MSEHVETPSPKRWAVMYRGRTVAKDGTPGPMTRWCSVGKSLPTAEEAMDLMRRLRGIPSGEMAVQYRISQVSLRPAGATMKLRYRVSRRVDAKELASWVAGQHWKVTSAKEPALNSQPPAHERLTRLESGLSAKNRLLLRTLWPGEGSNARRISYSEVGHAVWNDRNVRPSTIRSQVSRLANSLLKLKVIDISVHTHEKHVVLTIRP